MGAEALHPHGARDQTQRGDPHSPKAGTWSHFVRSRIASASGPFCNLAHWLETLLS